MMKRILSVLLAAALCVGMLAGCNQTGEPASGESSSQSQVVDYAYPLDAESVRVYDVAVPSRGIEIPGTLTLPAGEEGELVPLVILEHDLFGDRSTDGVFEEIALALADKGIASIAVDFSGCGDSSEDFSANSPFYIDFDVKAARDFAIQNAPVDSEKLGLLGYGFGARMAMDAGALKNSPYTAMSLIAPMVGDPEETMQLIFGSEYDRIVAEAFTEARSSEFVGPDGVSRSISVNWIDDMRLSCPMNNVENIKGSLQVIYATNDEYVPLSVVEALLNGAEASTAEVTSLQVDSDHSFGFDEPESPVRAQVIEAVAAFFDEAF